MVRKKPDDYIEELSKMFPEVNLEDLKRVILVGNNFLLNKLRASEYSSIASGSKNIQTDTHEYYLFYTYKEGWKVNRQCNIKKKKNGTK